MQQHKEGAKMRIGFAEADITPRLGLELSGYGYYLGRQADAVLDPLYVRALALEDKHRTLLLVNCDLIGLTGTMVRTIKAAWKAEYGLENEEALLLSTHTHSGPGTGLLRGCGEMDVGYVQDLTRRIVQAGRAALGSTARVTKASRFNGIVENIAWNRVFQEAGPIDKGVYGLVFEREDQAPVVLVSYACHPVTLGPNHAISADYPGRVVKALNRAGYEAVFATGFSGDIDPVQNRDNWGSGTEATIDDYGRRIADAALRGMARARVLEDLTLDALEVPVQLRLQSLTAEMVQHQMQEADAVRVSQRNYARVIDEWLDEMRGGAFSETETTTVQVLRVGEVLLVGFPGEAFTQLGLVLKRALPQWQIITLGTANEVMRYIPVTADQENRGYASHGACRIYDRLPLQSEAGEYLVEATIGAIQEYFGS